MFKRITKAIRGASALDIRAGTKHLLKSLTEPVNAWSAKKKRDLSERIAKAIRRVSALDIRARTKHLLKSLAEPVNAWSAKKVVTLDIEDTVIRLLEANGSRVRKWASASFEPDKVEEEEVSEDQQAALGKAVKQLMVSNDISAKKIIVSLSGLYSISRIVPLPTSGGGLPTQEAIRNIASEAMPLAEDQLYLLWKIINSVDGEQQVFVVGALRDVMDGQIRALKKVGINPHIIELKALTLSKVINKKQALILNMEPSSFDIIVVVNSIPVITHTTAWQQSALTAEDKAEQLGVTLDLTLDFYNSHHPEAMLDSATTIFITGQLSTDTVLIDKLKAMLRYNIEPLTPPLECPAHLPVSQYATNIGLALKGRPAPKKNREQANYEPFALNLLPQAYRPWRPSARQIFSFTSLVIVLGLLLPLYQVTTEAMDKTANLEVKYTSVNSELQVKRLEIKNRESLQAVIDEYRLITTMGGNFTEDLKAIRDTAEKLGVQLEHITHEGKSITVNCGADSYVTFRKFADALKGSERFSTVKPPSEGFPFATRGDIKLESKASK